MEFLLNRERQEEYENNNPSKSNISPELNTSHKESKDNLDGIRYNDNLVKLTPNTGRRNRAGSLDELEAHIPNLLRKINSTNELHISFILGVSLVFFNFLLRYVADNQAGNHSYQTISKRT